MKDKETIRRFIDLRAQGLSFAAIAAQLKVSKPTLILWSRTHQFEIQNLRAVETEALAERCFASRQHRWEQVAHHLHRVEVELARRDLKDVSTSSLLLHAARLRQEIRRQVADVSFSTPAMNLPSGERFTNVLDWAV